MTGCFNCDGFIATVTNISHFSFSEDYDTRLRIDNFSGTTKFNVKGNRPVKIDIKNIMLVRKSVSSSEF